MAMIHCPECGKSISDRAKVCPNCGYIGEEPDKPISKQKNFEVVPRFQFEIEGDNGIQSVQNFEVVKEADNKAIYDLYGKWKNIERYLPSIAEAIKEKLKKEKILVADISEYTQNLINSGEYYISHDKDGRILPQIRGTKKGERNIREIIRLKEEYKTPQLANAYNNIVMQATMTQILNELGYIQQEISGLFQEFQNDRLALGNSARLQLECAMKMQDSNLKQMQILQTINNAVTAKESIALHLSSQAEKLLTKKKFAANPHRQGDKERISREIFSDMQVILDLAILEYQAYLSLGELDSAKQSLIQFREFLIQNRLNSRDRWLAFNEFAKENRIAFINEFSKVANQIESLESKAAIEPSDAKENSEREENSENERGKTND